MSIKKYLSFVLFVMFSTALVLSFACEPPPGTVCSSSYDCRSDEVCVAHLCRQTCNYRSDCPLDEVCHEGYCFPPEDEADAGRSDASLNDAALADSAAQDVSAQDARQHDDANTQDAMGTDLSTSDHEIQDTYIQDSTMQDGGQDDATVEDATVEDANLYDASTSTTVHPFLRANGGLESGQSEYDGKVFYPLNDYYAEGDAPHNSDEALRNNYAISGTAYPDLYRVETWLPNHGTSTTFRFPVDAGDYTVHLHFVDWATSILNVGDRVFHVDLQGQRVLSDFDIIAEVGKNAALVKSFDVVSTGQVELRITNVTGYPEIAGVEIVPRGQAYLGQATTVPAAPTNLVATTESSSSVSLTWTDNATDESSYQLQWALNSEGDFAHTVTLGADINSHTVQGLQATTTYKFRVAATNSIGPSAFSNVATATTQDLATVDCGASNILCVDDSAGAQQEYASIQAAVDAASANDTIYVRAGTYAEELTIAQDHLTLSAYPGEEQQAVITGASAVGSWSLANTGELDGNPNAAHIYVADSPCDDVQRLFKGENELRASRYPAHGETGEDRYLHISSVQLARSAFSSSEISKPAAYVRGARAHVRTAQWRIGARRVTSQTAAGAVVLEGDVSGYDMNPDWGLFFTQVVGEIAANGEWASRDGKIYLMSDAVPTGVEAACRDYGVHITSDVTDLTINAFKITRASADGIHIDALTDQGLTISNNLVSQCVRQGIYVETGHGVVNIDNNEIADCWLGGIHLHSSSAPVVRDNSIHDIGASLYHDDVLTDGSYGECTGILLINGEGALIQNNDIQRIAYNGIAVIDFGASRGRSILNNYVNEAMLGLNDGAGIYFGVFEGDADHHDIIDGNIVENCIGGFLGTKPSSGYYPQGAGIYSDDGSEYLDIYNNVMSQNAINLFLHDSAHNDLDGNIIYGATRINVYMTSQREFCTAGNPTPRHNDMNNNVLFLTNSSNTELQMRSNFPECGLLDSADQNAFHGAGSSQYIIRQWSTPDTKNYYDLAGWQAASTFEQNSTALPTCTDSQILLNPSTQNLTCAGTENCLDETGAAVAAPLHIAPYSAQILCSCSATPQCSP